ncbi:MAG: amidoligase family protein [Clostridiales bacterium]|nr:amidoligase family protein [Clostridiales bacterium]
MNENIIRCCEFGDELAGDEVFTFHGRTYCEECFENCTVVCEHCGERIYEEDSVSDSNISLCQYCYDNYYSRCDECERLIHNDDVYYCDEDEDYPLCYNCYSSRNKKKSIHEYSYKPNPIFYGNGNRFFGVELEVDEGGHYDENAREVLNIANKTTEDRLYIKTDGSLENGFEMVSHPMTLEYHNNEMVWAEIMKKLVNMGYKSHKTGTCGLHFHVNRESLGDTHEKREETIGRIIYFVEHHWEQILRFSRRTRAQMDEWASRYGMDRRDNPKRLYDNVKKYYARHKAVNIQNYSTIEFRMCRGTLKYETFIASMQLINEICNSAVALTDEEMQNLTWTDFISKLTPENHKELIEYLTKRGLYTKEAE